MNKKLASINAQVVKTLMPNKSFAILSFFFCASFSAFSADTPTPYSDAQVLQKYRSLGADPTKAQLDQVANDLKASGIDFKWTADEVIKLETGHSATTN